MIIARHLTISGRVQGVYYRESMRLHAAQLGVTGWVRNRPDGSVEAHVQGSPEAVAEIVAWCQIGPPSAKVSTVDSSETACAPCTGFERLRTD